LGCERADSWRVVPIRVFVLEQLGLFAFPLLILLSRYVRN
jgi:hypothetical protein